MDYSLGFDSRLLSGDEISDPLTLIRSIFCACSFFVGARLSWLNPAAWTSYVQARVCCQGAETPTLKAGHATRVFISSGLMLSLAFVALGVNYRRWQIMWYIQRVRWMRQTNAPDILMPMVTSSRAGHYLIIMCISQRIPQVPSRHCLPHLSMPCPFIFRNCLWEPGLDILNSLLHFFCALPSCLWQPPRTMPRRVSTGGAPLRTNRYDYIRWTRVRMVEVSIWRSNVHSAIPSPKLTIYPPFILHDLSRRCAHIVKLARAQPTAKVVSTVSTVKRLLVIVLNFFKQNCDHFHFFAVIIGGYESGARHDVSFAPICGHDAYALATIHRMIGKSI